MSDFDDIQKSLSDSFEALRQARNIMRQQMDKLQAKLEAEAQKPQPTETVRDMLERLERNIRRLGDELREVRQRVDGSGHENR